MEIDLELWSKCASCDKPTQLRDLYAYGSSEFKGAKFFDVGWAIMSSGSPVCYDCQAADIAEHTFSCLYCGASFWVSQPRRRSERCEACREVYVKKTQNVANEKRRTRDKGLPSSLKQSQWIETLAYFDNSCAYCGGIYRVIEHFTPVKSGGGTGADNCIPACELCNRRKKTLDGRKQKTEIAAVLNIPVIRLVEIERYLDEIFNQGSAA